MNCTGPYMHAVAQLVKVLRYKPEGLGFDFRCRASVGLSRISSQY